MAFGFECTLNMARTLTPPRAGAPVTRRSMLQRWRTHAAQEAPQWFPLCESNTLPWIRQINRWFPVPKYREWVDMEVWSQVRSCGHPELIFKKLSIQGNLTFKELNFDDFF